MAVVGVADERAGQLPRVFIVPGDNLTKEAVTILINKKKPQQKPLFVSICIIITYKIKCMFVFISQKTIMKKNKIQFLVTGLIRASHDCSWVQK